ncbi:glycosyltransferase 87 family protein, partial [[Eubacterium] cellulosolvens]
DKGAGNSNITLMARLTVLIYVAMLIYIAGIGYYLIPYIIFLFTFLVLILNFSNLRFFKFISPNPLVQKVVLIFIVALVLRFILLFQEQVITRDIEMYAQRTEWLLAGKIPYQDFHVNKPPMYAYLLQFLGLSFGPDVIMFRAFFSIIDAFVAVLILYLCKCKYDDDFSFKAGFAYAICPVPIVMIGLSGHYEPVVMVFVILALIFLYKSRYYLSSFFLGLGFALKFFPLVLLPFFVWKIKTWPRRIKYVILFVIPIILTFIPMLIVSPENFLHYLFHQGYSWPAKKSLAFSVITISGVESIFGLKISFLFTVLFLGIIACMFFIWVLKRFKATFWFKVIILCYGIHYGLFITASIKFFQADLGLVDPVPIMATFAIIYFPVMYLVFDKYQYLLEIDAEISDEMFILSAFALIFMVFGSSQNNPWYILWFLPFVLVIKNNKLRLILLWVIFWNFEGLGLSLLPGFGIG